MPDKPLPTKTVDACGLLCPEPLMLLHGALNDVTGGESVEITGDDPASVRDIRKLCRFLKHQIIFEQENAAIFTVTVQKKAEPA